MSRDLAEKSGNPAKHKLRLMIPKITHKVHLLKLCIAIFVKMYQNNFKDNS